MDNLRNNPFTTSPLAYNLMENHGKPCGNDDLVINGLSYWVIFTAGLEKAIFHSPLG